MKQDIDDSDVISLFKKENHKVQMCVGITLNMSKTMVSVLGTGNGSNLVREYFLLVKWGTLIRPIHNMSLKPQRTALSTIQANPSFLFSSVIYTYVSISVLLKISLYPL